MKTRLDKIPSGKLSDTASLTLEQFVSALKKRIQEKQKLKNEKQSKQTSTNDTTNILPKESFKSTSQPKLKTVNTVQDITSDKKTPNIKLKKKKETKQENRVTTAPNNKNDAKIVTDTKPRLPPSISNKQEPGSAVSPVTGVPAPVLR